ncbi:DUF1499 domain-containing protein [Sulfitobacter geojensis]|nr:DUF1499 domain-containing protein [Sulfitobacter geojensis]
MLFWIVIIVVVVPLAYIRLAPSDPARFNRQAKPVDTATELRTGGYVWRKVLEEDGQNALRSLADAAAATPRTQALAGSVEEGQITYVTRTKWMGFPDYTTFGIYDTPKGERYLEAFGRARFGRSDLGVNAKRIKGWLAALK